MKPKPSFKRIAKNRFTCLFLIICFTLSSTICHAQITFESKILNSLDQMSSRTNSDNIIAAMSRSGVNLKSDTKDRDGNRLVDFAVPSGKLSFCYAKNNKLIYIRMDLPKGNSQMLVAMVDELKKKEFVKTITRKNAFTEDPMTVNFKNAAYPYQFLFYDVYPDFYNVFTFNSEFGTLDDFELK